VKVFRDVLDPEVVELLRAGGVGVLRTDTLYGVVARADDEAAVARVYRLKGRDEAKSPIVLIGALDQLFDEPDEACAELFVDGWPARTSIIMPSRAAPVWIRRENDSVAYRLPADDELRRLLRQTGALIAPSANPEGLPPAMNIVQAQAYFGDEVDFYVDGGQVGEAAPSRLLRVAPGGEVERLR